MFRTELLVSIDSTLLGNFKAKQTPKNPSKRNILSFETACHAYIYNRVHAILNWEGVQANLKRTQRQFRLKIKKREREKKKGLNRIPNSGFVREDIRLIPGSGGGDQESEGLIKSLKRGGHQFGKFDLWRNDPAYSLIPSVYVSISSVRPSLGCYFYCLHVN